eukprot:CAMPEP_0197024136 /NCGR_PEP_ID=MMETSP1384-20130603/4765_1 /TAXON_ID=29189 /ORGANISM="Ammonia sp." /LENGTH=582 /DNA_ID=CAMNT_0042452477 /DNA_START=26 /DNA_END=1774 /DNA_ORIENTATION=+
MPVLTRSQRKKLAAEKGKTLVADDDAHPQGRRIRVGHIARKQSKSKRKQKATTKAKPKSKRKTNSQPTPRRTRRKSVSTSSKPSDPPSPSPSSSSSNSNKRKLSDRDEKVGTPPNKRKKTKAREHLNISPSKQLAKLMDTSLHIASYDEVKDEEDEQESEEERASSSPDRNERIMELQEKLLTQELDYNLTGRDTEYKKIKKFIELRLKTGQGDSFYICGSPGTGKSATMRLITKYFSHSVIRKRYKLRKVIQLNGMSFSDPKAIYSVLYNHVFDTDKAMNPVDAKNKLEKFFVSSTEGDMFMVVIDEMDGLLGSSQQQVLYHLFGWTKRTNCRLILFGIANSIDLTDRFLPRLKQRNFEPELLIFEAYTKQQLIRIIQDRMIGYDYFEEIAIDLCATKVAKMYGDIRKCLEICRNALNLLLVKDAQIDKIGFLQMRQILATSFESPLIDIISDLPNHQKTIIVIMSVLLNERITKKNQRYVCYSKLEAFYHFMSQKHNLPKTSSREFNIIIDSLITDNIVKVLQNNYNKALATKQQQVVLLNETKLQLMVPADDIQYAVQSDETLHKLLQSNIFVPPKYLL